MSIPTDIKTGTKDPCGVIENIEDSKTHCLHANPLESMKIGKVGS